MYYQQKCPECGQIIHIHVMKNQKVYLNDCCECLINMKQPLFLKQTEELFRATFRTMTNEDGSKTKVFL